MSCRCWRRVTQTHGKPQTIRVDNGPEFISKSLDWWAYWNDVKLDFSRPGKPTDNALIESFNGKFREECLNQHWFLSLDDAQEVSMPGEPNTTTIGRTVPWETGRRSSSRFFTGGY